MPSVEDEFVPDFDNFDELPPAVPAPVPAADAADQPCALDAPTTLKKESRKKVKKGKKSAKKNKLEDDDESSAYPTSITPSPPPDHGALLSTATSLHVQAPPPPPPPPPPPAAPSPPMISFDDEATAVEEAEQPPTPPPSLPSPKAAAKQSPLNTPAVRSPRLAQARLALAPSPPTRPVSLHGASLQDRKNSLSAYRPSAPLGMQNQQRRESITSTRPRFVEPPPPHMPQAHFFGLPDLGFNLNPQKESGKPAGSDGYCCRIDSLADAGDDMSATKARDALLVGCEGGLEVFRILPNKLEVVGRLEGLRGSVIGAKILPHVERVDQLKPFRPLLAVVVHGPLVDDRTDSGPEGGEHEPGDSEPPRHFQTAVEVYSLQTQHYIATLYRSAPVAIEHPVVGQVSSLPDPVGDLHLDAKGQFVTVASGKSGEVFIFTQNATAGLDDTRFRCIGKFWTAIQKPYSAPGARPVSAGESGAGLTESKAEPCIPIYSLSQRWLAIVPPCSSSNISVQGLPLVSDVNPSPPGVNTHAAPSPPVVSCEVVGTDVEGAWSRLGRQAAQGLMKYSQRGLEMGLQGWKELTQPSPPSGRQSHERIPSKEDLFPPTKAPMDDLGRVVREPALVSLLDLESLLQWEEHKPKYFPPPMATFALVEGCNFLSLSSAGTRMLTSSRKGELSTIWDLQQAAHGVPKRGVSNLADSADRGPCITQVQRISRNSPSTVLDCAWSRDDDAVAILTAHGTVHLHEVMSRPPSRKQRRASPAAAATLEKADATIGLSSGMSPPSINQGFLGSIKSGWQTVSTQVNTLRSTNPASAFGLPTTFAGFKEATAAAGNAGSRAVARGLSQGYTAAKGGASDYWHADDNKIRHTKALQEPLSARSLRWIRRNNTSSVVIACGGSVHFHPVQRVTRRKGDAVVSGLKHEKYARKAFPLPPITTRTAQTSIDSCAAQGPHGFWSLRHPQEPGHFSSARPAWKSAAQQPQITDVETNPPYCPFHVDPRVNILAFPQPLTDHQLRGHNDATAAAEEEPWTFGEALPLSVKINGRHAAEEEEEEDEGEENVAAVGRGFDSLMIHGRPAYDPEEDEGDLDATSQVESRLTIQPAGNRSQQKDNEHQQQRIRIHTTRKRGKGVGRGGRSGGDGTMEAFEDDDLGPDQGEDETVF